MTDPGTDLRLFREAKKAKEKQKILLDAVVKMLMWRAAATNAPYDSDLGRKSVAARRVVADLLLEVGSDPWGIVASVYQRMLQLLGSGKLPRSIGSDDLEFLRRQRRR